MKKNIIIAAVIAALFFLLGFLAGKSVYDRPVETTIERDTVVVTDTVTHYLPTPKDSIRTKYVTRWLAVHDTTLHIVNHTDTVAVEVPITSKHYGGAEYDAWVSGFEPSLDSIKVYQRTEYITETITLSKPPNKWELNAVAGIDYNTAVKNYTPYAGGELLYKPSRVQLGINGGILYNNDKAQPFIGGKVKVKIL